MGREAAGILEPRDRVERDSLVVFENSLEYAEWEHILRILEMCGNNRSRSARVLRLHRESLLRKLRGAPAWVNARLERLIVKSAPCRPCNNKTHPH